MIPPEIKNSKRKIKSFNYMLVRDAPTLDLLIFGSG